MWEEIIVLSVIFFLRGQCTDGHCIDIHSHIIAQGLHYVPGPNSCTLCICDKGGPKWCKSVLCSQPQNCKSFQRGNNCCDFKCLDDILAANDTYKDTYDLALPLFASVVFAVITLSLLFFVVHRFRRHKLQERRNRQISDDQRSLNSIGYIAGGLRYLPGNVGYLRSSSNDIEFHYEETSNHLSLWKPPGNYFPRGEAPPPYEEAVRFQNIENNTRNQTNNSATNLNQTQQHSSTTQTLVPQQTPDVQENNQTVSSNNQTSRVETNQVDAPTSNTDVTNRLETALRTDTTNRSEEYVNITELQQERVPLVEQTKIEVAPSGCNSKFSQSNPRHDKHHHPRVEKVAKNIFSDKGRWYENVDIKPTKHIVPESRITKDKLEASTSTNNNLQTERYKDDKNPKPQNVTIRGSNQASAKDKTATRTLEKFNKLSQKCLGENRCENMDVPMQKVRQNSVPAPPEFQNEKSVQVRDARSKDVLLNTSKKDRTTLNENAVNYSKSLSDARKAREQIFVLDSKAAPTFLKDLKKSLEDCRELPLSSLRDPKDVPVFTVCSSKEMLPDSKDLHLHCTLPKNLKELTTEGKNNDLSLKRSFFKRSDINHLHRSLPKHLNNCDISLPVNFVNKFPSPVKDDSTKECPLLKPVDIFSSTAKASNTLDESFTAKKKDGQNLISYQCLSSSQDDDDYRSECENCKSVDPNIDEESDVFNETMTLQRRPLETVEEVPYYRTSLTLPTQIKRARPTPQNAVRESWFMAMQETSSSEESE